MTINNPFDTSGKRAVRDQWNTPFLEFLNQKCGFRYRYMGLPGVDLIDVKQWRHMIEEVIAFELPAKPTQIDPQGRRRIRALRRNLRILGIPGHAFFGPMEEVVILRRDYDGKHYDQKTVMTLYNLDFCDEISSSIPTKKQGKRVWRFEAIRQIFRDQKNAFQSYGGPRWFIVLLTVRDQIDSQKLRELLSKNLYEETVTYLKACGGTRSLPAQGHVLGTHTWALKAFIHNTLRQYLVNPNIAATFFPFVKYVGSPVGTGKGSLESPMLHCMFVCRFDEQQTSFPLHLPGDYLSGVSSVSVTKEGNLGWDPEPGEPRGPKGEPSPLNWFEGIGLEFLKDT